MKAEENKMITTSDVMVGDWVRITIEGEQYPAVVNSIKLNTEEIGVSFLAAPGDWEDGDGYDEIEPIPLTEEILMLNFPKPYDIRWYPEDDSKDVFCIAWEEPIGLGYSMNLAIRYVHELQHVLRMCGIKKDLKLEP